MLQIRVFYFQFWNIRYQVIFFRAIQKFDKQLSGDRREGYFLTFSNRSLNNYLELFSFEITNTAIPISTGKITLLSIDQSYEFMNCFKDILEILKCYNSYKTIASQCLF